MNWPPVSPVKMGLEGMHLMSIQKQERKTVSKRVWKRVYISYVESLLDLRCGHTLQHELLLHSEEAVHWKILKLETVMYFQEL